MQIIEFFLGYCESLVPVDKFPMFYRRYVDDTFAYFSSKSEALFFKELLDKLHPSLKFTCEFENKFCLSFLDVLVDRSSSSVFSFSVYRKPTFTGLLTTWDSYCSRSFKLSLVKNLVHRAVSICSPNRLSEELDMVRGLLMKNGYPDSIIRQYVTDMSPVQTSGLVYGPKKRRVILRLPWYGDISRVLSKSVRTAVESCYHAVDVLVVFVTARLSRSYKDFLPIPTLSNVIYQFECRSCSSRYIGRTSQRLTDRIKQHVPRGVLTSEAGKNRPQRGRPRTKQRTEQPGKGASTATTTATTTSRSPTPKRRSARLREKDKTRDVTTERPPPKPPDKSIPQPDSAIHRHLLGSENCRLAYRDLDFSVVCRARSSYHLQVLEAVHIVMSKPVLCVQKSHVLSLHLVNTLVV